MAIVNIYATPNKALNGSTSLVTFQVKPSLYSSISVSNATMLLRQCGIEPYLIKINGTLVSFSSVFISNDTLACIESASTVVASSVSSPGMPDSFIASNVCSCAERHADPQ